jgi:hypothetical protein
MLLKVISPEFSVMSIVIIGKVLLSKVIVSKVLLSEVIISKVISKVIISIVMVTERRQAFYFTVQITSVKSFTVATWKSVAESKIICCINLHKSCGPTQ